MTVTLTLSMKFKFLIDKKRAFFVNLTPDNQNPEPVILIATPKN